MKRESAWTTIWQGALMLIGLGIFYTGFVVVIEGIGPSIGGFLHSNEHILGLAFVIVLGLCGLFILVMMAASPVFSAITNFREWRKTGERVLVWRSIGWVLCSLVAVPFSLYCTAILIEVAAS